MKSSPPLPIPAAKPELRPIVRVNEQLPYFPSSRARQLAGSRSSAETIKAEMPEAWSHELFTLDDDELSDPEPLTSSSLSSRFDEVESNHRKLSLPTPARLTRRSSSGIMPVKPSPIRPSLPSLTRTVATGRAGELSVPALEPSIPQNALRRGSADAVMQKQPSLDLRSRSLTLGALVSNYFAPASCPMTPIRSHSPKTIESPVPEEAPRVIQLYVVKVDIAFCPKSTLAPTCRALVVKLRRLSDPRLVQQVNGSVKPPKVVTTLLPSIDTSSRIRVHWSNGRIRDLDATLGVAAIMDEIQRSMIA